ncbi:DNA polymerase domain-containing protein, partial [Klebsiella pneumoniae]|uniref:DNA polymerase domain-containing protein n=1 Tax=Klebsiella pneumoniae TaxID=573 RepID=UPI0025A0B730
MKSAKNDTEYNILNGIQLAIKVVMNSFYGILGATFGDLSERNIASTVTARGREALQQAKHYAKKWYDCDIIYG